MKQLAFAALAFATLALAGCQDRGATQDEHAMTDSSQTHEAGIAWQYGEVDKAFALAREENRPLFLFWSAEWCPDCAQIKATIFSRREFIDRTRLFIPVYLDGDTDQAQRLGDEFGVYGYPTMIIFAPDGTQITRLPGAIDIVQYSLALDTALAVMTPVPELIRRLLADGSASLGADECRLLAYYSWEQDNQRALAGLDPAQAFSAMAQACPSTMPVERSRLEVEQLNALLAAGEVSEAYREPAITRLLSILSDPATRMANLDLIINRSGQTIAGLTGPGTPQRQALESGWTSTLDALESGGGLSATERTYLVRSRLRIARMDDAGTPLPGSLRQKALEVADWVDANTRGYDRQSAINAVANTLTEAGLYERTIELLGAELEKANAPFYFMNKLSIAASKAGKTDEAIAWLRKAHADASGPATRFQWGVNLVVGLVEMTPGDTRAIESAAVEILTELGKTPESLYNRNVRRLKELDATFRRWNQDGSREQSLDTIREAFAPLCAAPTSDRPVPAICREFLAT